MRPSPSCGSARSPAGRAGWSVECRLVVVAAGGAMVLVAASMSAPLVVESMAPTLWAGRSERVVRRQDSSSYQPMIRSPTEVGDGPHLDGFGPHGDSAVATE